MKSDEEQQPEEADDGLITVICIVILETMFPHDEILPNITLCLDKGRITPGDKGRIAPGG